MSYTYSSCLIHFVFSTKERIRTISPDTQKELYRYIGGIARNNGMRALAVGGAVDHVHVLTTISADISISKAVQLLKGNSSRWIKRRFPHKRLFEWQKGYGAFSVGISQKEVTIRYINGQMKHHEKRNFQSEFIAFLKKHPIEYDERYVWG